MDVKSFIVQAPSCLACKGSFIALSPGNMLSGAGLGEEGVEGVISTADGLVRRHLPVRLDAMLQAGKKRKSE
jgi:hypothetical protein